MLPDSTWFLLAAFLSLLLLVVLPFRGGRRRLLAALPATALLLLWVLTAEIAVRVGRAQGGGGAATVVHTCSMHPQVRHDGPGLCPICHMELVPLAAAAAAGTASAHEVRIDPVVVQNMGVRLSMARKAPLLRTLRAFGELRIAEDRRRDIALKVPGFVERLFADTTGMAIARGAPLFELYSPALSVAVAELIAAQRAGDPALLAAARQKLLRWDVDAAVVDALQARDEPPRAIPFQSPIAGVLVQKDLVAGAPIEAGRTVLQVADQSVLWLDAQVPEGALGGLEPGQSATATLPALPGRELRGTLTFVAAAVDPTTRTATVRWSIDNPDGSLRPGMFARAELTLTAAADILQVPAEAILDTGIGKLAWIAVGKGRFEPRRVTVGRSGDDGAIEVLAGIADGEAVVVSGQFLIDAESRLREGTRKFADDGLMPDGDVPLPTAVALSATTQTAIDGLAIAYAEVGRALAADREDPARWAALRDAAASVATAGEPAVQRRADELALALQHPAVGLEPMRIAFKTVSSATVRLFAAARPTAAALGADRLYVHHCPMAEADWLQTDAATQNPYYGSSMLECGAVRREVPLTSAGGR